MSGASIVAGGDHDIKYDDRQFILAATAILMSLQVLFAR